MIGLARVNKNKFMTVSVSLVRLPLVVAMAIIAMATISVAVCRVTDAMFHDGEVVEQPAYFDQAQYDHWLDSASNWRYWDVAAPQNSAVEWSYQVQGFESTLVATSELNRYSRLSHTLQIRFIQLSDVGDLTRLLATPEGIKVLMSVTLEMIPSAISVDDYTLVPGQTYNVRGARQQGVQYVVISGYAGLDPSTCCRVVTVPTVTEAAPKRDKSLFNALTFDVFASEEEKAQDDLPDIVRPASLRFNVVFAEKGISQFNVMAY